jgi:ribosomal protein S18 acetylase RimI-like enzyme
MRIIREASVGDATEIEKLIKKTLPNDPVVIFLKGTRQPTKFFESLILSNKAIVSIDGDELLGMASVGSIFVVFRSFIKKLSLIEITLLLIRSCTVEKMRLVIELMIFMLGARYKPSENEISWLAVNPQHQGEGIGKSLVREIASHLLQPHEHLMAKTLEKTPDNVDFYRACGMLLMKQIGGRVILQGSREQICIALNKPSR